MTKRVMYAGTFDPFTNGHNDIVERALKIFDEVIVVVAVSPTKKTFFTRDERVGLLKELFKNQPRVKIDSWDGLVVDYARLNKLDAIVRGLRPTGDFEIEFQMASMNRKLNSGIETVFMMTGENLYYISSSLVKEVYEHGGDVEKFVPRPIFTELMRRREARA